MSAAIPPAAAAIIAELNLEPLDQEGGFFRRSGEASLMVKRGGEENSTRAYSVIYALYTAEDFSALHVLRTDEIWCWHAGDSLESLRLYPDGRGEWVRLGMDLAAGDQPQNIVAADVWQGTRLVPGGEWALVSCVVAPEFRWEDFTLAERTDLSAQYPDWQEAVRELSRTEPPKGQR